VKYEIWRSAAADMARAEKIAESEEKQFTDLSLPPEKTVSYKVVAMLNGSEQKEVSSKVANVAAGRQSAPEKAQNFVACKRMDGGVSLLWEPPAAGIVNKYLIFRKDSQGKEEKIGEVNWDKLFYCDASAVQGAEYAVVAENSTGKGQLCWQIPTNPEPLQFAGRKLKEIIGYQNSMWQAPVPLKIDKNFTGVRAHPRVLFTEADIARGKENIAKYPWAKSALEQIVKKAETGMKAAPPDSTFDQKQAYAYAYVLTGEKKYAAKVAEFLLYYADRYKDLPLKNGEARINSTQMHDYGFARHCASEPYDLIYNSGVLSEKDKQHIENDLLRPLADDLMMPRRGEGSLFHTYINFQCMAVAAVGQIGFCLNEQKYIDWAINGKYGFFTLLAGGLRDDGLWWEKSIAYHVTTALPPLVELARAAYNNNIDLWNTPVPDRSELTNNFNYAVDGDNGPKTLKMAFEATLYAMFPDGSALNFGDSCNFPYVMNDNMTASVIYNNAKLNYRPDRSYPLIKIFCGSDKLMQGTPFKPGTAKFANNGICENGSSLFPSSGIAVLRSDVDNTDAHAVAFTFGPLGIGHNHGDKLAILLYANRYVPVFKVDYRRKDIYEKQTICDNTVTVDESSQLAEAFDSAQRPLTGRLNFFYADKNMQAVSAYTNNAYDGIYMERTLLSGAGGVADFFICRSPNQHQYDYALHIEGNWADNKAAAKNKKTLGAGNGYQFVQVLNESNPQQSYSNWWTYPAPELGHKIGISIFSDNPAVFFDCMAPGNKTSEAPMVVARVNAKVAIFTSFFDLHDNQGAVKKTERFETAVTPDKIALGLKVTKADCIEYFLYNESGSRVKIGPFLLSGKAAWARVNDGKITATSIVPFKDKSVTPQLILEQ
ncbi:MAG: alginate lyase family protein, partial [Victivallaceae bacterium]